jgi:hypothetical protein
MILLSYLRILFRLVSPLGFPAKILYTFLNYVLRATSLAHPILLHLINIIISDVEYRLWSSSPRSFLQPPATYPSYVQIFLFIIKFKF